MCNKSWHCLATLHQVRAKTLPFSSLNAGAWISSYIGIQGPDQTFLKWSYVSVYCSHCLQIFKNIEYNTTVQSTIHRYRFLLYNKSIKFLDLRRNTLQFFHEQTGRTKTLEQFQAASLLYTPNYLARYQDDIIYQILY